MSKPLRKVAGAVDRLSGQSGLKRLIAVSGQVTRASGGMARELRRLATIGVGAATALGAGVFGLVKSFANAGDSAAKASGKLGVGVEWLQRHRYAAKLAGIEQETFDMSLQRFARRASEAARGTGEAEGALRFLGIRLKDTNGNMRPTEQLLIDVADAMAKIEDPALRLSAAQKLFDAEGVVMINMLKGGSAEMAKFAAEADRLGIVLSEADAKAAEQFNDNLSRLGFSLTGIRNAIGSQLLPVIEPLIIRFREWAVANREIIATKLKAFIEQVSAVLPKVIEEVGNAARVFSSIASAIWPVIERFGGLKTVAIALATLLSAKLIVSILATAGALAKFSWVLATTPIGWFLGAVAAIAAAAFLIYDNWDEIAAFFESLWSDATAAFATFEQWVTRFWSRLMASAQGIKLTFLDVVSAIVSAINNLVGSLPSFVTTRVGLDGVGDFAKKIESARRETEAERDRLVALSRSDTGGGVLPRAQTAARPAAPTEARVTVEFDNLPRGARVKSKTNTGVDLDLSAGYSMMTP